MSRLPTITVVTPSYNQGAFLENTILSIRNQGYPHLEHIVMDGGSTDESVEIIRKYADGISYWRSQPDGGQSAAIAEGFARARGEILCWINSDDLLLPGALQFVGALFARCRERIQWMIGGATVIDCSDRILEHRQAFPVTFNIMLATGMGFCQQGCFWRRSLYEHVGGLNPDRRFCMDYDLFMRFAQVAKPYWSARGLGVFRLHSDAKTEKWAAVKCEEDEIIRNSFGVTVPWWRAKLYYCMRAMWTIGTTRRMHLGPHLHVPVPNTCFDGTEV